MGSEIELCQFLRIFQFYFDQTVQIHRPGWFEPLLMLFACMFSILFAYLVFVFPAKTHPVQCNYYTLV